MPKKRCAFCKEYGNRSDMVQMGLYSFCSEQHRLAHQKKSNEKKAKRQAANRSEPSPETRDLVFSLDDSRCRWCGKQTNDLILHHIVYRSEFHGDKEALHSVDNLITLCNYPCHLVHVHGNKKKYQPLCQEIVLLRNDGDRSTTIVDLLERTYGF